LQCEQAKNHPWIARNDAVAMQLSKRLFTLCEEMEEGFIDGGYA
jgi:hypothetical protein